MLILINIGSGQWIRWHKEYDVLADLGYLLLTTVAGMSSVKR